MKQENYLTISEVALILRVKTKTMYNRINSGDHMPPYFKFGRRILFPEADLYEWIKSLRNK